MKFSDTTKYKDIMGLPHPVSEYFARMPSANRAAIFSPFAALTGYDDLIRETARVTDEWVELHEDRIQELDGRLRMLRDWQGEPPEVTVTYFVPDARKAGGKYVSCTGVVMRYDAIAGTLTMRDGTVVRISSIVGGEGAIFDEVSCS